MKGTFEALQAEIATQLAEGEKEGAETAIKLRRIQLKCRKLRAAKKALDDDRAEDLDSLDQKKAPNQLDVSTALKELLAENPGGIDRVDLKQLLAEHLATKHHRSAVGLGLRIKEVLASGQFVEEDGEIRSARREPIDG
jgi:hypothetical protein